MFEILFICTGNTCRSPMAEGLLNSKAQKLGLPLHASSAGLAAFTGDEVSRNAVKVMAQLGIDISSHRASRLSIYAFERSDLIVCMSESQKNALPQNKKIIVPAGGISDPYGGDENVYRHCRDELSAFVDHIIEMLGETVIEPMNKQSTAAVAQLEKECFSVPWSEKAISDELENPSAHFFTAYRFGEYVGYIGMHLVLDECYITNIAVTEKQRKKGIGSSLLSFAEKYAEKNGASFISLEVRKSNEAAKALYNKHGFKLCGERKKFYTAPDEDGLIMTKFFDRNDDNENTGN